MVDWDFDPNFDINSFDDPAFDANPELRQLARERVRRDAARPQVVQKSQTNYGTEYLFTGAKPYESQRLIDVRDDSPGVWTLTVNATPELQVTAPNREASKHNFIVADVLFGAGGISQKMTLDVFPNSVISLPSHTCQVNFRWDEDNPLFSTLDEDAGVRVRATVSRGSSPTNSRAFRYLYVPTNGESSATGDPDGWSPSGFSNNEYVVRLPDFSRTIRLSPVSYSIPWHQNVAGSNVQYTFYPGRVKYNPSEMGVFSASDLFNGIAIPGQAKYMVINRAPGAGVTLYDQQDGNTSAVPATFICKMDV